MISRKTLYSFLLAVLLAGGLAAWSLGHRDDCDLAGRKKGEAAYSDVKSGKNLYAVPCRFWVARQPMQAQALAFLDAAIWLVFLISAWGDWVRFRERQRQWVA